MRIAVSMAFRLCGGMWRVMRPTLPCRLRIRAYKSSPAAALPVQRAIRAAYYRGGTSRAVIIHPQDLPSDLKAWPTIFRQLMGSGDPYGRQLDGMGAGISSLSKICLVETYAKERRPSSMNDDAIEQPRNTSPEAIPQRGENNREAQIDYTFVGLGIENDEVDVAGNCGNMSSAIGPYAYNARLLPRRMYEKADGQVTVRIRNTNTGKLIDSTFTVVRRQAAASGSYTIDGVTGKGSQIKLDFQQPYGSKTGKVLPTGKKVDVINGYKVTCVDGANPAVFIRASDIGVDGTILPNDFNKLPEKLQLLENIRTSAAVAMGIAKTEDQVPRTIPKIGIVSISSTHPVLSGTTLNTSQLDLVVRFISDTQPHRAIPLTAALTTAVAARIPGTIVEQLLAPDPVMDNAITIGHASGRLQVNATMNPSNPLIPESASVYRTAKRLFEGNVYWIPDEDPVEGRTGVSRKKRSLGMAFVKQYRKQSHVDTTETTIQDEQELTRTQEHVAPSLDESHYAQRVEHQPEHASLEDPVPHSSLHSSLEPPNYPSEEVSPRNFEPGPKPWSEVSEMSPEDQAQHLYRGTNAKQASSFEPSSASGETTWESPFSEFMDVREGSGSYLGDVTPSEGLQARSEALDGAHGPAETNLTHRKENRVTSAPTHQPRAHPSDPTIAKPNLKREITAIAFQSEALKDRLGSLKMARHILNSSTPSSLPSSSEAETDTSARYFPAASPEKDKEWHQFARDLARRTRGFRKEAKKAEEEKAKRLEVEITKRRKAQWALDKNGNSKQKIGRGW